MARARRGRGEGSVYQRQDGRWAGAVTVGAGPDGKRIRRAVYGQDKATVMRRLRELQADAGVILPGQVVTLNALLDRWLAAAKTRVKATSWARYDGIARLHIRPALGLVHVDRLTAIQVQQLVQAQSESPATARYVHAVLLRALAQGVRWGLVARNVAQQATKPRTPRGTVEAWTEVQARAFLQSIRGNPYEALFRLALSTGMRQGELFALHWDQVDLQRGTVRVTHSQDDVAGELARGELKTARSRRLITLDADTVAHLQALQRNGPRVFSAPDGGPLRKSNFIRRVWHPALQRSGLPPLKFHGLRHTHATLLLALGVHPKVVSERLGHTSVSLTLDTYSHAVPSMQVDASTRLGALLSEQEK